jgi:hypothetical protein
MIPGHETGKFVFTFSINHVAISGFLHYNDPRQKKWARSRDTLERAHLRNGVSWLLILTQQDRNRLRLSAKIFVGQLSMSLPHRNVIA